MSEISDLISTLQKSGLNAECPKCGVSSGLSDWQLFDGLKPFPKDAEEKKQMMEEALEKDWEELKKDKENIAVSERSATAGGIGKIAEVLIPAMKRFGYPIEDCRFLAGPIDYIIFDGASQGNVSHITFMDIKTGAQALKKGGGLVTHQRKIRDAVNDNNVKFKVL